MISLIMPTLNAQAYIREALNSVLSQQFDGELEVIVADGGSTDQTMEIASNYGFVRVLDGADTSIYEGFNRGISSANGQIIGILNADDILADQALHIIQEAFEQISRQSRQDRPGFVSGGASFGKTGQPPKLLFNSRPLSIDGIVFGIPAINARFFSRETIENTGLFLEDTGLASDREYLLRICQNKVIGHNLQSVLYQYRMHEGSSTIAGDAKARRRVWQAQSQFTSYLQEKGGYNPAVIKAAKTSETLIKWKKRFKLHRDNSRSEQIGNSLSADGHDNAIDILAAALKWYQWRGQLSGW